MEKGTMSVVKYNSLFFEKLHFGKTYHPTMEKHVEHYAEGLLAEYRATVRQCITLVVAMDEVIQIKVNLATPRRTMIKGGEKRKWEGLSESSRKKKRVTRERRLIGLIFA